MIKDTETAKRLLQNVNEITSPVLHKSISLYESLVLINGLDFILEHNESSFLEYIRDNVNIIPAWMKPKIIEAMQDYLVGYIGL